MTITKQEVQMMIAEALKEFKEENLSFKSHISLGSVIDVYSPITGASPQIGFFGTPKISKPVVSGSKGANAALASLMTALANLGLVTNNTS